MSTDVRSVRFRDLRVDDPVRKAELLDAVDRVLTHGRLLMGGEVETFERAVAEYCGTSYCVGVSSGTDALYMALRAAGVGPSDEVTSAAQPPCSSTCATT
jgi:dTDP-4-amino-4,6-dideoxygalactose transaminase